MSKAWSIPFRFFGSFLGVMILVGGVNLAVDPSQEFGLQLRNEERLAAVLSEGKTAITAKIMNMHVVRRFLLEKGGKPDVVVLGSSRVWELGQWLFPSQKFLNFGTGSATLADYVSLWGMLDHPSWRPKEIIIGADPWIFNRYQRAESHCKKLSAEFQHAADVIEGMTVQDCRDWPRYRDLFSLRRLQTSWQFVNHIWLNVSGCRDIQKLDEGAPVPSGCDVWHADGTMNHFHLDSAEAVAEGARTKMLNEQRFKFFDSMVELDAGRIHEWRQLLRSIKAGGVKVAIFLSPFHPAYLKAVAERIPGDLELLKQSEATIRAVAADLSIPVYGGYQLEKTPCRADEFYDSIHIYPSCMDKIGGPSVNADFSAMRGDFVRPHPRDGVLENKFKP